MNPNLKYCVRCCMPETQEGQSLDSHGYCNVCRSSEEKMRIDWSLRRKQLVEILEKAKKDNINKPYDCLIPISGGKDSTYQLHVLVKEFNMRPLAVTFSHNWYSSVGMLNLVNSLEIFDIDHIMFTPKRSQVNKLAKKSLSTIGDACWHCHAGIGAFPLKIAKDYGIGLLIWGESVAESSSRGTYAKPIMKFDQDYFLKVSAKVPPSAMVEEGESTRELKGYETPTAEEYASAEITGIHLGDYIFWDEERQTEFIQSEYGWKETAIEGTYKRYKSAECIMPGVHDFANYLKRGYGRASFHASGDVRAGIVTREEAFEHLVPMDSQIPRALEYFEEITGITREEFLSTLDKQRHPLLKGQRPEIKEMEESSARPTLFIEDLRRWVNGIEN
jgi:N-acetyl sugar amidotransferase